MDFRFTPNRVVLPIYKIIRYTSAIEDTRHGLPYRPISEFYRERFGGKVYKIPVSIVDDCPNRRGLKGMQTCIFCDEWGSAARAESLQMELKSQIENFREVIGRARKAEQFLVYFQAYTSSFARLPLIKAQFESALTFPDIKGFVVGTRPDCLSSGLLRLWQEVHERSFVSVEFGVQSFFTPQLEFLRRGHSGEDSIKAIQRVSRETQVDLGLHLIFGLPGETLAQIRETAKICNDLPIQHVKLHNLHVLKNTPLAELWQKGEFAPIELEAYAERVEMFLSHLRPGLYIQRLAAYSSRRNECLAPAWTCNKMRTHQFIIDYLREHSSFQSKHYLAKTKPEISSTPLLNEALFI